MDIDRRKLLEASALGLGATTLGALPARALPANARRPAPVQSGPLSPIFGSSVLFMEHRRLNPDEIEEKAEGLQPFDIARFYSGNADQAAKDRAYIKMIKRHIVVTDRTQPHQMEHADTVEEVEDRYLAEIAGFVTTTWDERRYNEQFIGSPNWIGEGVTALPILVYRQTNLISQRTRAGTSNRVFAHPRALASLHNGQSSFMTKPAEPTEHRVGRWTEYLSPEMNKGWGRIFVCEDIRDDMIFVTYNGGDTNGPMGIAADPHGGFFVARRRPGLGIASETDYGGAIRIAYA